MSVIFIGPTYMRQFMSSTIKSNVKNFDTNKKL